MFSHIFSNCLSLSLSHTHTHTHACTHSVCLSMSLSIRMGWTWKSHPHQELSHLIALPRSGQTWKPWSFAFVQLLKNNEKYIPLPIWLFCVKKEPPLIMGNLGPIHIQIVLQTIYICGHFHTLLSLAGYEWHPYLCIFYMYKQKTHQMGSLLDYLWNWPLHPF